MFFDTLFSTTTTMIAPKTEGGKQLYNSYNEKIAAVVNDQGTFARSGPDSKSGIINTLHREYNSLLTEIEEVSDNEILEASRPQMKEPTTEAGKSLKARYDLKITELAGKDDEYELVNAMRDKFNTLLMEIEG